MKRIGAALVLAFLIAMVACAHGGKPDTQTYPTKFNDNGAPMQKRVSGYFQQSVVSPKLRDCWSRLQGQGAIAIDFTYRKSVNDSGVRETHCHKIDPRQGPGCACSTGMVDPCARLVPGRSEGEPRDGCPAVRCQAGLGRRFKSSRPDQSSRGPGRGGIESLNSHPMTLPAGTRLARPLRDLRDRSARAAWVRCIGRATSGWREGRRQGPFGRSRGIRRSWRGSARGESAGGALASE